MAGVGFSLRTLSADESYTGLLRLYATAGVISSGPWLLSILSMLFIGVLGPQFVPDALAPERCQVTVTWLFATSLVWTGPWQLMFTRFAADREFLGRGNETVPNLFGMLALIGSASAACSAAFMGLFSAQSLAFKVVLCTAFVTLCEVWMVVTVLSGLRKHRSVLGCFAVGYAISFIVSLCLARFAELGLLAGFAIGQAALLFCALGVLLRHMPASREVAWDFLRPGAFYFELGLIGVVYNLAVWIDKLLFWLDPATSRMVIGPLRASEVYDLPIFLGYLTIVPGMAVFLIRVETDFAERHAAFYSAIRAGAPLRRIEPLCAALTDAARRALLDIVRAQGLTLLAVLLLGAWLLRLCGISELHLPLLYIDAVGTALQVLLLAVTSMFFYLDRRRSASQLCCLLLCTNAVATVVSQKLGAQYYGYGFALAMALTSVVGLLMLSRALQHLVRDTFMRQPGAA